MCEKDYAITAWLIFTRSAADGFNEMSLRTHKYKICDKIQFQNVPLFVFLWFGSIYTVKLSLCILVLLM
jgi:hypothetical protein